jgi:hypothetical protein
MKILSLLRKDALLNRIHLCRTGFAYCMIFLFYQLMTLSNSNTLALTFAIILQLLTGVSLAEAMTTMKNRGQDRQVGAPGSFGFV